MKNLNVLILISVVTLSACTTPSTIHSCPTSGAFNKHSTQTVFKEDGSGTQNIEITAAWCRKGSSFRVAGFGASLEGGKVLFPPQVEHVNDIFMISDKRAYVYFINEDIRHQGRLWDFESNEKKTTDWQSFGSTVASAEFPGVRVVQAFKQVGKTTYYDAALFVATSKEPRVLKNLGGPGVTPADGNQVRFNDLLDRFGDIFVTRFTAPDGKTGASQILNLSGDPISPMIGLVRKVHNLTAQTMIKSTEKTYELVSEVASLGSVPRFPDFLLSLPLNARGEFMTLPKDVVGVSKLHPLKAESYGWLVFFQGKDGIEGGFYRGTLESLGENVGAIKRFSSIAPVARSSLVFTFYAMQPDKKWRMYDAKSGDYLNWPHRDTHFETWEAVTAAYKAYYEEENRKSIADFKARQLLKQQEEAKAQAAYKAQVAGQLAAARGTQFFCYKAREVAFVGEPFLSEYVAKCTPTSMQDVSYLRQAGVSAAVTTDFERKVLRKNAADQARLEADRQAQNNADLARAQALKAWSTMGPLNGVAAPQQQSDQQKRYQMERDVNKQIFNKAWDPYK